MPFALPVIAIVLLLDHNLGAAGLHLSAEETARLDETSRPVVDGYPYGELGVGPRDRRLPAPGPPRADALD